MNYGKARYAEVLLVLILLIYFLREVFSGYWILPQYFNIGPLVIHYYGIIMALAVSAAFYFAIKRSPKYGVDPKAAEDLLFWLIIGGFIGARLYHVASSFQYYYQNPIDIIKVWNGGLSIYGAILGGLLTLWVYRKLSPNRYPLTTILDWLTPSLLVGQIIGRFGNLFNYEAFGYPTNLPWKMFVPFQFRPQAYQSFNFFHPFFLYELLGNLFILFFLLKMLKFKRPGALFFSYLLLYNSLRFCLEFLRIDTTFIGNFRLNAIVSLVLAILGGFSLILIEKNEQKLKK